MLVSSLLSVLAALAWMFLGLAVQAQTQRVEILLETEFGRVGGDIYRVAVCPNGVSVVTGLSGGLTILGTEGAVLVQGEREEIRGATACSCDHFNRIYVAAEGWVQRYDLSEDGQLTRLGSLEIPGTIFALLATPNGQLYVAGDAEVDGKPAFLRRFRLTDGALLGVVPLGLPTRAGRRPNELAFRGSLLWHPTRQQVIYVPANPFRLFCFDGEGRITDRITPAQGDFEEAALPPPGPQNSPDWTVFDRVDRAIALPSGDVYLQIKKGIDTSAPKPLMPGFVYLVRLDSQLRASSEKVPNEGPIQLAFLAGADSLGHLYFVELVLSRPGRILKARIVEP